jgi:hypothetical protein
MSAKKHGKKILKRRKVKKRSEHRIEIMARLKKSFNDEDKTDPFNDREYVDESNRIFDILMEESPYDPPDCHDRAIFDIVYDIFRECGKET